MISININFSHQHLLMLISISLFLSLSKTEDCSTGCLICSTSGACSLCDVENSFTLTSDSKCEHQSLANCLLSFDKDKCEICSSSYYSKSGECTLVENDDLILGCIVYSSSTSCSTCSDDYFLEGNTCQPLTSERKVEKCLEYSSEGCEMCVSGFPDFLKKQCITWNEMDFNCMFYYKGQKCLTCDDGYQMSYQVLSASDSSVYKKTMRQNVLFGSEKIGGLPQNKCFKINDSNSNKIDLKVSCEDSLTLSEACVRCDSSTHYFDFKTKTCVKNPSIGVVANIYKIENCLSLNLNFECVLCYNGFFLNYSKKKCHEHTTKVANCLVMSQSIDSHCLLCESSHFLDTSNNSCTLRSQTVENCSEYNFFEDKCNICDSGFSIQDNGTKCLEIPENCETPVSGVTVPLNCEKCSENFHLFTGACLQIPESQKIEFCETYSKSSELDSEGVSFLKFSCETCLSTHTLVQNKFLLAENHTNFPEFTPPATVESEEKLICILKTDFYRDIAGCNKFINGECEACTEGGKLYTVENSCQKLEDGNQGFIEGCNVYKDDGTCEQCIYSYKNESDGKCYSSNLTNCRFFKSSEILIDNPLCISCNDGFALHDGNCYDLRSAEALSLIHI